jgi:hypothetical protein
MDPGPLLDNPPASGVGGRLELEPLLLEFELGLLVLDLRTRSALDTGGSCSGGVEDEIINDVDVADSSIGAFVLSVFSLICGIFGMNST